MKRAEYLYRVNSDNWGDYQVLLRELKSEVSSNIYRIALVYWNVIQELEGNCLASDGWGCSGATPRHTKELGFHLVLKLSKPDGYSINSYGQERGYGGFGGCPEEYRQYSFITKEIVIPTKFIEDFNETTATRK